jgi:hypothetical protein
MHLAYLLEVWRSGWPILFIITTYLHGKQRLTYVLAVPKGRSCSKRRFYPVRKKVRTTPTVNKLLLDCSNGLSTHSLCVKLVSFNPKFAHRSNVPNRNTKSIPHTIYRHIQDVNPYQTARVQHRVSLICLIRSKVKEYFGTAAHGNVFIKILKKIKLQTLK